MKKQVKGKLMQINGKLMVPENKEVKDKVAKFEIDGKLEVPESKEVKGEFAPKTLLQLFGDTGISKYKTFEESEYEASLQSMNKSDLQAHAIKMGLIPIDNRVMLTQRLTREFRKHVANFRMPKSPTRKEEKVSPEVLKILAEGR